MRRRSLLRAAGSLALFGLAGCSSGGGRTTGTDTPTEPTPTATATSSASTADHLDEANAELDAALAALDAAVSDPTGEQQAAAALDRDCSGAGDRAETVRQAGCVAVAR